MAQSSVMPVGVPAPALPGLGNLAHQVSADAVQLWFGGLVNFVARLDRDTLARLWQAVSASTAPVLSGGGFGRELQTMAVLAAEVMLPLLLVAVIQAIVRQDAGGLLRTAFVRVPLALLFTAVAAEIVSFGLRATDEACASLLRSSGRPLYALITHLQSVLGSGAGGGLAASFLFLLIAGALALIVWLELAVRSAAVAVAVLFLPLALAGSALPATAHWARRLGETLTALVLSKLAIVAVLTLAVSVLGRHGGAAAITEGVTLLALAAVAPLALAKVLPMVEAGAIGHLEGLGRRSVQQAVVMAGGPEAWIGAAAMGSKPTGGGSSIPTGGQPPPEAGAASADRPSAQTMPKPPPARPTSER